MRAESVGRKIKTIRSKRLKERTCRVIENWVSQHKLFLSQHSFIVETDEWNTFCLLERSYSCWREGRGQSERARERERGLDVIWCPLTVWYLELKAWRHYCINHGRERKNRKAQHGHPILSTFVNTFTHTVQLLRANRGRGHGPAHTTLGLVWNVCCHATSKV